MVYDSFIQQNLVHGISVTFDYVLYDFLKDIDALNISNTSGLGRKSFLATACNFYIMISFHVIDYATRNAKYILR